MSENLGTSVPHTQLVPPRIIVAMDFSSQDECLKIAKSLNPSHCRLKVGKELFTACGPGVVRALHDLGFEVFLDLKFHDIPATVAKAVSAAADMGVWMVNVHASGGESMLSAAAEALANRASRPKLIAVTILTSMSQSDVAKLGYSRSLEEQVVFLAQLSHQCSMDGVVCSSKEAGMLKQQIANDFLTVTPGIRPSWAAKNDQQRILTPEQAVASGSDYLVIGRPITQSQNPAESCERIYQSIQGAA